MKFMGSKQALLRGDLGIIVLREASRAQRFVDLFSGSGATASFVASRLPIPVLACDLQNFAVQLAADAVERPVPLSFDMVERKWLDPAITEVTNDSRISAALEFTRDLNSQKVMAARHLCKRLDGGFIWRHYGGHYFSPYQALVLDALHSTLPSGHHEHTLTIAALIRTASRCAAAPGHTAQPFQPTPSLLPAIEESWARHPIDEARRFAMSAAEIYAQRPGLAVAADARHVARRLYKDDVVFVDPPYSDVQYSRFYHVLEAVAIGGFAEVFGAGRSPDLNLRKSSVFSRRSSAMNEFTKLMKALRDAGVTAIVTFPDVNASNGMSARKVIEVSSSYFSAEVTSAPAVHSTLGGSRNRRPSRRSVHELIMVFRPR
jgi:adenine-specific DNA-methyltransferase